MRILIVTASYAPVLGGLQLVTSQLARGLTERGHEVRVVTNRYPRSLPEMEIIDGVPVWRWLFLWPKRDYWRQRRPDLGIASLVYGPAIWQRLRHLLSSWEPEVINLHFPDVQTPFLLRQRGAYNGRLVVSLHGDEIERFAVLENGSKVEDLRALLNSAEAITACSSSLLDVAGQIVPGVEQKGLVIYNGFDPAVFTEVKPFEHARPFVLAYGRFTYKKGFDLLLQAWAENASLGADYDLILAGDGEQREFLQQLAQRLDIADRVQFFGRAAPEEVASLLAGSAFMVVPSRQEPFGIAALEALGAGRRVLATEVGGLPELMHHAASPAAYQLVPPTVKGLAAGLRRMMAAPAIDFETDLDDFTWDRVVDRYEQVLLAESQPAANSNE